MASAPAADAQTDAPPPPVAVTRERLLALPKPELHVHLDGSLRPATLIELARERRQALPVWEPDELARQMVASDTQSLEAYPAHFDTILSVMQDAAAIERVAYELAEDNARENVRYLEVRYSPTLTTRDGLSPADAVDASLRGLARAEAVFPIDTALIVSGLRNLDPSTSGMLADLAVSYKGKGVVAFDLAGAEHGHPAKEHREAFLAVAGAELGVTVHAGEGYGPDSIRQALRDCRAHRIGHGTRLREDADLIRYVKDVGIPLEVCITSNVQTGAVPSYEEHPVRSYFDQGLVVTLNTDNRLVSGTTLTDEYWKAHRHLGFTWSELQQVARMGFQSAFLPQDDKVALLERVELEMGALP